MAKPPRFEALDEVEVTLVRRVGKERFDVVVGTIKGPLKLTKQLERGVTLVVARGTARASIDRQSAAQKAGLGLAGES